MRGQAQSALAKAGADIAAETAAREAEFAKKMADQTAAAEAGIRAAKAKALADVRGIAAEVAALMAGKLTGASVDSGAVAPAGRRRDEGACAMNEEASALRHFLENRIPGLCRLLLFVALAGPELWKALAQLLDRRSLRSSRTSTRRGS